VLTDDARGELRGVVAAVPAADAVGDDHQPEGLIDQEHVFVSRADLSHVGGGREREPGGYGVRPGVMATDRGGARAMVKLSRSARRDVLREQIARITAPTLLAEVRDGQVTERTITPQEFGIDPVSHEALQARDLQHAAELMRGLLLGNVHGAPRDMLLLNAGMALVAAGQAADLASGMDAARAAIDGGAAARTLERLRAASRAG
jgi:hypothetical protein